MRSFFVVLLIAVLVFVLAAPAFAQSVVLTCQNYQCLPVPDASMLGATISVSPSSSSWLQLKDRDNIVWQLFPGDTGVVPNTTYFKNEISYGNVYWFYNDAGLSTASLTPFVAAPVPIFQGMDLSSLLSSLISDLISFLSLEVVQGFVVAVLVLPFVAWLFRSLRSSLARQ